MPERTLHHAGTSEEITTAEQVHILHKHEAPDGGADTLAASLLPQASISLCALVMVSTTRPKRPDRYV
jgi:hypothetical protein